MERQIHNLDIGDIVIRTKYNAGSSKRIGWVGTVRRVGNWDGDVSVLWEFDSTGKSITPYYNNNGVEIQISQTYHGKFAHLTLSKHKTSEEYNMYIIITEEAFNTAGYAERSMMPTRYHKTLPEAEAEAIRLSTAHQKEFYVFKSLSKAVPPVRKSTIVKM